MQILGKTKYYDLNNAKLITDGALLSCDVLKAVFQTHFTPEKLPLLEKLLEDAFDQLTNNPSSNIGRSLKQTYLRAIVNTRFSPQFRVQLLEKTQN